MVKREKTKVLYFLNDLANGGIETFCLNVNRNINREKYDIDYFLTLGNHEYYRKEVENLGAKVFNIKKESIPKYIPNFCKTFYIAQKILNQGKYSAIHIHQCKGIISILLASYFSTVPVKCVHSHNAFIPKSKNKIINIKIGIYSIMRNFFGRILKTYNLGCSKEACIDMFGKESLKNNRTKVIFNGIELSRFDNKMFKKEKILKKYNINTKEINFISIGRYEEQKNHLFLIDAFNELVKLNKNVKLTLVGHGILEEAIRSKILTLGLENYVNILPQDTSVPEILSIMDYFLLPSLYEGLGIVLIEAQASGVQCFASNYVPEEANVGLCEFIPLEIGVKEWAKQINDFIVKNKINKIDNEKLSQYDIESVCSGLEQIYSGI